MPTDFTSLRRELDGGLLLPGDDGFAALSSPFNLARPTHPAAVVAAAGPEDIAAAVRFASAHGLPVAVQATGHGTASDMAGALLIHTGALDECTVHPDGWARVGAGVRWQQVLDAAAPFGLAGLCGSAANVGVVGYLTGGGIGPLTRAFGPAADHVRAFDVVTGDGTFRRTTAADEPDLFWGLRGGKGSLGIVTAADIDLVPVAEVYGGSFFFDGGDAPVVLHTWRQWCEGLPDEAGTSLSLMRLPAMPGVPEPLAGRLTVAVRFVFTGSADDGEALLAPIRRCATSLIDTVSVIPYQQIGSVHADPEEPAPVHDGFSLLADFPEAAADALLTAAGPSADTSLVAIELRLLGGALARPPRVPNALCHRDAGFSLFTVAIAPPDAMGPAAAATQHLLDTMSPWTTGGSFLNFGAGTGPDFDAAFDAAALARLTGLADRYDPGRVFRIGQVPRRATTLPIDEHAKEVQ